MRGAIYGLEQCGLLLRDAVSLYHRGSNASSVVLAAFAREELGRANILLHLRAKAVAGEIVTNKRISECCRDHVAKQRWATLSVATRTDTNSVVGKPLQTRARAHPHSDEWKTADKRIKEVDARRLKSTPNRRHQQRERAIYVEPDASGTGWNRPHRDISPQTAYEFLTDAVNDYAVKLQLVDPDLEVDKQLLEELEAWHDRPDLPAPLHPDAPTT
jgi:AbiV family abortive infection protein